LCSRGLVLGSHGLNPNPSGSAFRAAAAETSACPSLLALLSVGVERSAARLQGRRWDLHRPLSLVCKLENYYSPLFLIGWKVFPNKICSHLWPRSVDVARDGSYEQNHFTNVIIFTSEPSVHGKRWIIMLFRIMDTGQMFNWPYVDRNLCWVEIFSLINYIRSICFLYLNLLNTPKATHKSTAIQHTSWSKSSTDHMPHASTIIQIIQTWGSTGWFFNRTTLTHISLMTQHVTVKHSTAVEIHRRYTSEEERQI
jgi:hypothetical protein